RRHFPGDLQPQRRRGGGEDRRAPGHRSGHRGAGQPVTALAGVLEDYCRVYEDLLSLARRKREILLAGRPQDLEPVVQAEEALLSRLGRLDDALEEAQRALPGSRAGDGGSDPLAGLEPGRHQELEALVARLRSTLDE